MIDSRTFDREEFVKRAMKVGLALPTAEFFANEWAHIAPLLHGQKHAPSPASAD